MFADLTKRLAAQQFSQAVTPTPVIPRTAAPHGIGSIMNRAADTVKTQVATVAELSQKLQHGFFGKKKALHQFTKQDYGQALSEEIKGREGLIRKALLEIGVNAEPTPDTLVLAYTKYGNKLVEALEKNAPIGGLEGQQINAIVTANPLAAFNLVHSNDYKEDAEFYANLSATGGKPKAPESTKDWWQTFDWGGVLKGSASILTAVTGKGNSNSNVNVSTGASGTNTADDPKSNKTLWFGVVGLVVLGIVLYFVSRK